MTTSVLVIGASGYIGASVAFALRRAGFRVYGLIRTKEKGAELEKNEIIPVVADAQNVGEYKAILEKVSSVVDTSFDYKDPRAVPTKLLEALSSIKRGYEVPKKTYVYTSGIMTYGNQPEIVDETTPFSKRSWRSELEESILSTPALNTIIIRPGFVYGGSGGYFATNWFEAKTKLVIIGSPTKRYSWVHVDDLGEAYARVVQRAAQLDKEVFNISDYSAPTYEEVMVGLNKVAGFNGPIEHVPAKPGQETHFDSTVVFNPAKAHRLLGWYPKHLGILAEAELYYRSYLALLPKGTPDKPRDLFFKATPTQES